MSRLDKIVSEDDKFKLDCLRVWNMFRAIRRGMQFTNCLKYNCEYCPFLSQNQSNKALQALMPELNQK